MKKYNESRQVGDCHVADVVNCLHITIYPFAGSAKSMLSGKNVVEANRFVKELSSLGLKPPSTGLYVSP